MTGTDEDAAWLADHFPAIEEALYEKTWNAAHADLLILSEADRVKARTLVADLFDGDFNLADKIIGLLHRNEFEIVSAKAMVATPAAVAAVAKGIAPAPAAPPNGDLS